MRFKHSPEIYENCNKSFIGVIHTDVVIVGATVSVLSLSALDLRYLITVASMSRLLSETPTSLHAARTNKNTSKQLINYVEV